MSSKEKITPTLDLANALDALDFQGSGEYKLFTEVAERLRDLHRYLGECRKTINDVAPLKTAVTGYLVMLDQHHEKPDDPVIKQMEWDALERICNTHPAARESMRDLGISMLTTWKRPLWKIYEPDKEGEADVQAETD